MIIKIKEIKEPKYNNWNNKIKHMKPEKYIYLSIDINYIISMIFYQLTLIWELIICCTIFIFV